jgi:EAL domain-containing protein (putative c-di-GMP-specific phosphodiesterase class I)
VALDDVGAGYSSLNLVHELRPDILKLDMELTRDVHKDAYQAMIVRKLLEVSSELGIETVGEGVERDEDFAWLREHGATYAQGYLFGAPAPG